MPPRAMVLLVDEVPHRELTAALAAASGPGQSLMAFQVAHVIRYSTPLSKSRT